MLQAVLSQFLKVMIFLGGHTFQLKVLLSAMGNAHSPPSWTSFRKTMIVRYLTVKK